MHIKNKISIQITIYLYYIDGDLYSILVNRKCVSNADVVLFIKLLLVYLYNVELVSLETFSPKLHWLPRYVDTYIIQILLLLVQ